MPARVFLAKEEKSAVGYEPTKDRFTLRLNYSAVDN
jgi:hypothetical protein